ncbi:MAG: GspH/FimT family pseudopilin [Betaproteobacteria bacterium]|nr:GspH/FimT family pseudopilin [Betaproteobacteria bacterium]
MGTARISVRDRSGGVTLVELITVIAIIAVLASIAMPSLAAALLNQRLRAAGTDLVSALLIARSEAIKRGAPVEIAPQTPGDWKSGWKVAAVASGEQIDKKDPPGHRVEVTRAPAVVTYERNGRLPVAAVVRFEFSDSEGDPGIRRRCVTLDPSGMPRLVASSCP